MLHRLTNNVMAAAAALSVFLIFGSISGGALALTPQVGQWWNPNESGSGYNIDFNNGTVIVTIYSYKTNGDSEWYLAAGPIGADGRSFTAALEKYRSGQCISCAYSGSPTAIGDDGQIGIYFFSETSAQLTLPGGRVMMIQPFFPAASSTAITGTYRVARAIVDFVGTGTLDTADGSISASGSMTIAGNQISSTVTVTVAMNGATSTVSGTGTFVDHGGYVTVTSNQGSHRVTIIQRGPSLIYEDSFQTAAGPATQIIQWERVSQ